MMDVRVSVSVVAGLFLVTALAVVHIRHQNRLTFLDLQALQAERDRLNVEWGQLLLERGTWGNHQVVEQKARSELHMTVPSENQTVSVALQEPTEQ